MRILGIGNALVDIMVSLPDDEFLMQHQLPRGSMQLVNKDVSDQIFRATSGFPTRVTSGGSAANTINGLARMGVTTGFIGRLGKDDPGQQFISDFHKNKVYPHISYSDTQSGKAIALVSPDGERTFATYLGAAVELGPSDISDKVMNYYDLLHIEGYLLQNYELIEKAIHTAITNNVRISLDLASYNVVEEHIDFLKKLIPGNVHILFANEEEAFALTGEQPDFALKIMSEMAPISILKTGASGSMIHDRQEITHINALASECKDTTGAGDLYAAGFLYGLISGKSMDVCGSYGSILAGHVIRVIGAKIHEDHWEPIIQSLDSEK